MVTLQYRAIVKESRLLELPKEAQELGLLPGEEVEVTFNRYDEGVSRTTPRNEGMLAALAEVAELDNGIPFTDGSNTQRLLNEARDGAMY